MGDDDDDDIDDDDDGDQLICLCLDLLAGSCRSLCWTSSLVNLNFDTDDIYESCMIMYGPNDYVCSNMLICGTNMISYVPYTITHAEN